MLVSLLFHNPTITRLFMTKQRGLFSFQEPGFVFFPFHGQHPFVQHCTKPVGQQDLGTCEATPEKSSLFFMDSHPFSRITPCAPQTQPPSSKILSALMLISPRGSGYILSSAFPQPNCSFSFFPAHQPAGDFAKSTECRQPGGRAWVGISSAFTHG